MDCTEYRLTKYEEIEHLPIIELTIKCNLEKWPVLPKTVTHLWCNNKQLTFYHHYLKD